jgi:hypothetical protein
LLSSSSLIPLSVRTGALLPWIKTAFTGTTKSTYSLRNVRYLDFFFFPVQGRPVPSLYL